MGGFYVVVIGRRVGVFEDWLEAAAQIDGVSEARHCKFKSRDQAVAKFEEARARDEVKVIDASPHVPGSVGSSVVPAQPSTLNGSSSQVRSSPPKTTNSGLPNESGPHLNEPRQRHISTASPIPESSTLVGGDQNTVKRRTELAESSRSSGEESFTRQSVAPGRQQRPCKASTRRDFRNIGVQTNEHHSPSNEKSTDDENMGSDHSRRARRSRIQRNIDSDLSEPESLVSVEIIDDRANPTKPKDRTPDAALPTVPLQLSRTNSPSVNPSRQHRVIETMQHHNTSSLEPFSTPRNMASTSSLRRVLVMMECDVDGYPSGDESSGPEDVTPRKPQITRRDKGKGKQSSLVFISSDDELYGHQSDSDSYDSEIAAPGRRPARNSGVVRQRSRETSSRQDVSAPGFHRSADSINLRANRESSHDLQEGNPMPHSFMLEALGLSQPAHVPPHREPGSDPRSPIRRTATVPESGRPSPRPLLMPFPKFFPT